MLGNETFSNIIKLIIIIGVSFYLGTCFESSRYQDTDISTELPDEILEENKTKIDSLETIVLESALIMESLKDSIVKVETIKEIEVNKVQELPLDEAAEFLTIKLREYEKDINK